jgi:hypothetical protein
MSTFKKKPNCEEKDHLRRVAAVLAPSSDLAGASDLARMSVKEGRPLIAILTECGSPAMEEVLAAIISASVPAVAARTSHCSSA